MKWFYLFIVGLGLLFIGGCTMPTPCVPSEMGIPVNMQPSGFAIVSLSPSLTWEYPSSTLSPYPYPSGTPGCAISGYKIYVAKFNDKYTDIGGNVSGASSHSFTAGPLEPATMYVWEAKALSSAGPGPWSGKHAFVTGPVCKAASLSAPIAHSPTGTINTLRPTFIWWGGYSHPASCTPEGYRFELSTDPSFGSMVYDFETTVDPSSSWEGWTPDSDLLDCTDYYWRIAGKGVGSLGLWGTQSFRTEVGICQVPFNFTPKTNANCRVGPNSLYNRVIVLNPGDKLTVEARHLTEDGFWFYLRLPDNKTCWVSEVTGNIEGDPNALPEGTDFPPLKLKEPGAPDEGPGTLSCSEIGIPGACVSAGCSWDRKTNSCN